MQANETEIGQRRFSYVLDEGMRILAVDDDPIQREFCVVYLGAPGVEVETAESGEEGLARLASGDFSAALVDVDMPGMGGFEMVRRLRADPRHDLMPVMMITGREDMASIDDAYEAGATSFMCKPVNWRLLAHQVRFMVRAHRALIAAERRHAAA